MATKKIEVSSIDTRTFMSELFRMFELGAKWEDGLFAVKRPVLSAQLLIDDKVDVSGSPNIRLVPTLAPEPVAKQKVDAPSTATASDKSPKTAPQAAQAPKQASPTPTQQASDKTPKNGVKQSSSK